MLCPDSDLSPQCFNVARDSTDTADNDSSDVTMQIQTENMFIFPVCTVLSVFFYSVFPSTDRIEDNDVYCWETQLKNAPYL